MTTTEQATPLAVHELLDPEVLPTPPDVLVGAGGDPLALGVSVFAVGVLTFGMMLVGAFPASAAGVAAPVAIFGSGIPLLITTVWGILRGQSVLAGIFGTVAGLFISYGFLSIGLNHNWYAISSADAPAALAAYFIAFGCYFVFLLVPSLKLPALYTVTVALVVIGSGLAAASQLRASTGLAHAAGADFLLVAFVLFWLFVNVQTTAVGMKPWPPIGQPVLTP